MGRDNFSAKTVSVAQRRAAYICSNPSCRGSTIAGSERNETGVIFTGVVAHITAAAKGGARYDESLTSEQRCDISNAIFLCADCSVMIDKDSGADYSIEVLRGWKHEHESWVRENLNKRVHIPLTEISGEITTSGKGTVVGLHIKKPTRIMPGTIVRTDGEGNITGTIIE